MSWKDEDPRAVVDYYTSTFDLAEEFVENIHRLRRMNASVLVFMGTWIFLLASAIYFGIFIKWNVIEVIGFILECTLLWIAIFSFIFYYKINLIVEEFGKRHSIVSEIRSDRKIRDEEFLRISGNPVKKIKEFVDEINDNTEYLRNLIHVVKISTILFIVVLFIDLMVSFWTEKSFLWHGALDKWDVLTAFVAVFLLSFWTFYEVQRGEKFVNFVNTRWEALKLLDKLPEPIKIPKGKNSQEKFISYLSSSELGEFVDSATVKLGAEFEIEGKSFSFHMILAKNVKNPFVFSSLLPRADGIYVRISSKKPTKKIIENLIEDVRLVVKERGIFPKRIFYIWKIPSGREEFEMDIDDSLYNFITSHHPTFKYGMKKKRVCTQIVFERPDGTYDFIPHVLGEG